MRYKQSFRIQVFFFFKDTPHLAESPSDSPSTFSSFVFILHCLYLIFWPYFNYCGINLRGFKRVAYTVAFLWVRLRCGQPQSIIYWDDHAALNPLDRRRMLSSLTITCSCRGLWILIISICFKYLIIFYVRNGSPYPGTWTLTLSRIWNFLINHHSARLIASCTDRGPTKHNMSHSSIN